jgi:hypothetical protein
MQWLSEISDGAGIAARQPRDLLDEYVDSAELG